MNFPKCLIVDLDGTLCDDSHRKHFVDINEALKLTEWLPAEMMPNGTIKSIHDVGCVFNILTKKIWKPDYESYFAAMGEDDVNEWCKILIHNIYNPSTQNTLGISIIFITGRPERYWYETMDWLERKIGKFNFSFIIYMRPDYLQCRLNCCCKSGRKNAAPENKFDPYADNVIDCESYCAEDCKDARKDHRPSHEVKREIFEHEIRDKYEVLFAIDDNEECCEMYKSLGLTVLKVF